MRKICCIVCLCSILCASCADFIDVRPENSSTYTNYYRTQDHAESLLTALELWVRALVNEPWTARVGERTDVDRYNTIPNKLTNHLMLSYSWSSFYSVIYQADLILDNAHRFELTEEELKPYLLQAYFAKGIAYFWLARVFGEAPITRGSTNFEKYPQSSKSEVLDEAEKWALKAMDLPVYEEMVSTAAGDRMKQFGSKGAAAALLAHLYAWRAGVEGKTECWEKAEEYCSMLIENKVGTYKLANSPEVVCSEVMKGDSDESIWEIYNNAIESEYYTMNNSYVQFPILKNSTPTDLMATNPHVLKTTVRTMYPEGDLRRDAYFWGTDAKTIYLKSVNGETIAETEPGGAVIMTYDNTSIKRAFLYKYRYPFYVTMDFFPMPMFKGFNQNLVVWRLADIYLLRAECRARQNKTNAVDDLNKVRSRAYGDLDVNARVSEYAFPCADDVKNGLDANIQLAIFREREKELLQERHRYYDIMRNGGCFLRGEDGYDYIREEISDAYGLLTDRDIEDGALYAVLSQECFKENDLILQNRYWNRQNQ